MVLDYSRLTVADVKSLGELLLKYICVRATQLRIELVNASTKQVAWFSTRLPAQELLESTALSKMSFLSWMCGYRC